MQSFAARFLFLLAGLFSAVHVTAQDKSRLHKSLATLASTTNDTLKQICLDNIGWDTSYDNLAVGLKYCQQSLALAEKIKFNKGIVHVCNSIGTIYEDMGEVDKALEYHL